VLARLVRPLIPLAGTGSGSATSWGSSLFPLQAVVLGVAGRGDLPFQVAKQVDKKARPADADVWQALLASPPFML
jgi:hypothetical protein